jgi:two-component system, OmpR family, sensor kinase
MASPASFIRSAAQATFSAYRTVPVRWRLGGGSAALTFVILAAFAGVVDVLTDRSVEDQFQAQVSRDAQNAVQQLQTPPNCDEDIYVFRYPPAKIRIYAPSGQLLCTQNGTVKNPGKRLRPQFNSLPQIGQGRYEGGYYAYTASVPFAHKQTGEMLYAESVAQTNETVAKVRVALVLGVLGGSFLALLAGLYVARRAMRPIAELTDVAAEIERTRDTSLRIPHPEAEDEVAELARTLESMLVSLDAARSESEAALVRQREFVADASHELRTPLTAVLANLELLADELQGEQAESAKSALRSTRRMRRLVGDLLLLARADVQREQPQRATDLATVLTDVAGELGAVVEDHERTLELEPAIVEGTRDDLHRMALNLIENALKHTPPGTRIWARTATTDDGQPQMIVEDDGPGIAPELQERVYERFVRGGGDRGNGARGTGLGLAIVDAVSQAHNASIKLDSLPYLHGTRFTATFPSIPEPTPDEQPTAELAAAAQTSTTTGSTIGRLRRRS